MSELEDLLSEWTGLTEERDLAICAALVRAAVDADRARERAEREERAGRVGDEGREVS